MSAVIQAIDLGLPAQARLPDAARRSGPPHASARTTQVRPLVSAAPEGRSPLPVWLLISLVVVGAHAVVVGAKLGTSQPAPARNEVLVELVKPVVVPPQQKPEPPKPKPEPPKVVKKQASPPPPQPAPALRTPVASEVIPADAVVIQENTTAAHTTGPVVAAPPAPPAPDPVKEEPVTEPNAYASYLSNPPPEYPSFALRQGWEGKVILRVRVLASGKPSAVEVKTSSGRKSLDEAAVAAVRGWTFVPSKRGSTPIDGWATVPIEFKLSN
ncbi:energy transducer TonB [Methyloversatilis universalis]|uniref:energy transducer TonB n=1 Tax=Methyloversatilis universalis TaxID=378211 RepID=UPI00036C00A6|nr:energy transducer TonB [Methyloversatilis universalis]